MPQAHTAGIQDDGENVTKDTIAPHLLELLEHKEMLLAEHAPDLSPSLAKKSRHARGCAVDIERRAECLTNAQLLYLYKGILPAALRPAWHQLSVRDQTMARQMASLLHEGMRADRVLNADLERLFQPQSESDHQAWSIGDRVTVRGYGHCAGTVRFLYGGRELPLKIGVELDEPYFRLGDWVRFCRGCQDTEMRTGVVRYSEADARYGWLYNIESTLGAVFKSVMLENMEPADGDDDSDGRADYAWCVNPVKPHGDSVQSDPFQSNKTGMLVPHSRLAFDFESNKDRDFPDGHFDAFVKSIEEVCGLTQEGRAFFARLWERAAGAGAAISRNMLEEILATADLKPATYTIVLELVAPAVGSAQSLIDRHAFYMACKLVALAQQGKQMALQASSHDLTNAVIRPQTLGYHLGLDTVLPKLRWDGTTSQPTAAAHPP